MCRRLLLASLSMFSLSGCDALITALQNTAAQPRFAYVTQEFDPGADPGGFDDQTVTELLVATISAVDPADPTAVPRAIPLGRQVLFEFVPFIDVQQLVWHPDGDHLAVEIYEDIAGFEFDIWVGIYTRSLNQQFLASDDNMAGDAGNICPTDQFFPPNFEAFVTEEINLGAAPPGTVGGVNWGSGNVLEGAFRGWLAPDRFVASIVNDPEVFLTLPDNTTTGPFGGPVPAIWGDETEIYLVYERMGQTWVEVECLDDLPAIPARPAPSRVMAIDGAGDVTLDGVPLLGLTGVNPVNSPATATRLDGPYP